MNAGDNFEQTVYGYWAGRFNCTIDDFFHSCTVVVEEKELADSGKVIIYHINQASVVRVAPDVAKQVGLADHFEKASVSFTIENYNSLVGARDRVALVNTLLDCFLHPQAFKPYVASNDFTVRRLYAENDNTVLLSLFDACTEADLDIADIYVDDPDPVIFGLFDEDQLVAYASHRYWDDIIADIGVLVHPDYRSRGLGKAVVSNLCDWCIRNEVVPMYRVPSDHAHSLRISQALGFKEMVAIETVKLITPQD